jgi:NDP-sugar pyrophosphorylase family protein
MKLFINAGGKGERLLPLTKDIPKPMIPIAGKPVLHHLTDWAINNGVKEIVMMNGHKAEKIVDYFKDGSDFGINISHSNEPRPLDSGGPIKFAKKYMEGAFIYLSGDHLCDVDLERMIEFHKSKKADMTILVHKSTHPEDSDILKVDEIGKITNFISKHGDHTGAGNLSNSGLCIIEPQIINLMDKEIFNFENYIYPKALKNNMNLFAYHTEEFMSDMGTFERLKKCEEYLESQKFKK